MHNGSGSSFCSSVRSSDRDYIANVSATNEAGLAFLAANKEKEGVVTLPSGLQYKVLSAGTGTEHPATGMYALHVITPTPQAHRRAVASVRLKKDRTEISPLNHMSAAGTR